MGDFFGASKVALWMVDQHFRRQEPGLFELFGTSCMKGSVARKTRVRDSEYMFSILNARVHNILGKDTNYVSIQ
jgi:hypothetical protein